MDLSLPQDFREFLKSLTDHRVRFLLVGGYAVVYHGHWRTTNDLDVWIAVNQTNANRVVDALQAFGFDVKGLSANLFSREHQVIRMGITPVQIDSHVDHRRRVR